MAVIDVYGKGWGYPPRFSVFQGVEMVSESENVRHNLLVLFSTGPGERIMRDAYGCDFLSLVFTNITESFNTDVASLISDSIRIYEPRVEVISVDVDQDADQSSVINISVSYRILGSDIFESIQGALNTLENPDVKWR